MSPVYNLDNWSELVRWNCAISQQIITTQRNLKTETAFHAILPSNMSFIVVQLIFLFWCIVGWKGTDALWDEKGQITVVILSPFSISQCIRKE